MKRMLATEFKRHPGGSVARATHWLGSCLLGLLLFSYAAAQGATATEAWVRRYNSGEARSRDEAFKVVADADSNVIVAGYTDDGITGMDMLVIKYSGAGVALWTNSYDGPRHQNDEAYAMAVDNSGNVFVTGSSSGDYATVAYSGSGVALWTNRYNGPANNFDSASAIAVDNSGNVFVAGRSDNIGFNVDYATVAYSAGGVALWTNRYNGPGNTTDRATAVAVNGDGNVFVTGWSIGSGGNSDYATIGYSRTGVPLWTNRYNGPGASIDVALAVAVDNSGHAIVAGYSRSSDGNEDYATIAYSGAGVPLWTNRYNGPANGNDRLGNDLPGAKPCLAVGPDSAVYVTGTSDGYFGSGNIYDFATVKYVWRSQLAIQPLTPGSATVHLKLSGPASSTWSIERAVTLSGPWTILGPSLLGTNGLGTFQDANPPAQGAFYRATQP